MSATLSKDGKEGFAVPPVSAGRDFVLVVEDDNSIGTLIKILLTPLVPQLVLMPCAEDCLRWFEANVEATGMVVMDCTLPDDQGAALAFRLREMAPGLPLLLISGRQQKEMLKNLVASGPTDFLSKPFAPGDIADRVRALLAPGIAA